jgi:hypothetical protein
LVGDVAVNETAASPSRDGRAQRAIARLTDPRLIAAFLAPLIGAAVTLDLVLPTLLPGVSSWDTAEFQTVGPLLGTAHPTGYASYIVLGWLASIVLQPFGDPAYRMNLLQALLAAFAVAGTIGTVQVLTGMRWIAVAAGLLLAWNGLFWQFSTHADPDMFHLGLVAFIFVLLLVWERRRRFGDTSNPGRGDRLLVAMSVVYGVAWTNHSLVLMLAPAIGLFILAVEPRILLRGRIVGICAAAFVLTTVGFYLELPIRAAMHAPIVYGHPDTLAGLKAIITGEQFQGALVNPFGDLGTKAGVVLGKLAGWLGPLGLVAVAGFLVTIVRRPRYALLSGLSALATCWFLASYSTADKDRYYLVPLMVAYTWIALAAAELTTIGVWSIAEARASELAGAAARWRSAHKPSSGEDPENEAASSTPVEASSGSALDLEPSDPATAEEVWGEAGEIHRSTRNELWRRRAVRAPLLAILLLASVVGVVPEREFPASANHPAGVSQAGQTGNATWLHAILASPADGGLPADSVVVSWWSVSTTLWYGQKVEGLRPDVYVVDDRTRLDQNLGNVWDVINSYLGKRPGCVTRLQGGVDGIGVLSQMYELADYRLPNGSTIKQVIKAKGTQ